MRKMFLIYAGSERKVHDACVENITEVDNFCSFPG